MMINVCCTANLKVTVYQIRFDRLEVTETVEVDASKNTSLHPLTSMVKKAGWYRLGHCGVCAFFDFKYWYTNYSLVSHLLIKS